MSFNNHFTIDKTAELVHLFFLQQITDVQNIIYTFFFFLDQVSMKKKIYSSYQALPGSELS